MPGSGDKKRRDAAYYAANRKERLADFKARYKKSRTDPELAAGRLVSAAKMRARKRGVDFALVKEDIIARLEQAEFRCERTGIPFVFTEEPNNPFQMSIDRIDSSEGYTLDNVQLVVLLYNWAKNQASDDDILHFARELIKNHS